MTPWPEMWRAFGRIGLLSFGGPAAQIAIMQEELVDRRGWLDRDTFLRGLGFCTLLPGPEAMQLATFAGWRLRGTAGGLLAGLLFVMPGALVMMGLAWAYLAFGRLAPVEAAFAGVKAAVLAIVLSALWKLRSKVEGDRLAVPVALAAFVALFVLGLPFWAVIGGALILGLMRGGDGTFAIPAQSTGGAAKAVRTIVVWLIVWWAPLIPLILIFPGTAPAEAAVFFSWLATVSFGGAYALLAALAQTAVEGYGWLTSAQMIDGLGLAETTPGPLVLVTVFAAWLGGAGDGGLPSAILTACVALWATFVPCFLWIFAGAPHLEMLSSRPRVGAALQTVTAAVAGVIANLAVVFGLAVLWPDGPDLQALSLAALAAGLLWSGRAGLLATLAICATVALLLHVI
ncbi:chromate efflux transporter [Jannaschia aquimarina]|uniref:SrpC protein n=1 Tax=Jannaschia aquimarina TaxID=935700 RepID=A0A0D1EDT4_9RHOB|nr:chromate efflux transporter [Jannaschia aquimarina]KIT15839.1 putative chromate transport protein [Jannaschia aquimarina]SNT09767.1 chromate transporter [Jannaschia aquimarina]